MFFAKIAQVCKKIKNCLSSQKKWQPLETLTPSPLKQGISLFKFHQSLQLINLKLKNTIPKSPKPGLFSLLLLKTNIHQLQLLIKVRILHGRLLFKWVLNFHRICGRVLFRIFYYLSIRRQAILYGLQRKRRNIRGYGQK